MSKTGILTSILVAGGLALAQTPQDLQKFDSELNTPGVVFDLEEVRRSKGSGHTVVAYKFITAGIPVDKELTLWHIQSGTNKPLLLCPVEVLGGEPWCQLGGRGSLGTLLNGFVQVFSNYVTGEPVRYLLVSLDQTVYAFVKKIPFPIEDQDGSCRISVEMSTVTGRRVVLSGFPVGEQVEVRAKVGRRTIKETFMAEKSARQDGLQKTIDLQPSRGRGGKATVEVKAPSCGLFVTYKWGSKAQFQ